MIAANPKGLDSNHRVGKDLLILEGNKSYKMSCFLQHDNRTEQKAIELKLVLLHREDTIYHEAIPIKLSEREGVWLGQGFLNHEVEFAPSGAIHIPLPGIYRWELYSPSKPAPQGITLVGFRLH